MKPRSASSFFFVAPNAPQRHKIGLYIYAQRVLSRAQFWISSRPTETIGFIVATFFTLR